ncbi:MAG: hypothetical protein WBP89_10255 [Sedimenticolaceae bacterium]
MNMQSSKQRRLTTLAAGVALALASGLAAALPDSATESRSAASSAVQQLYGPASFSSLVDRVISTDMQREGFFADSGHVR